MYACMPLGDSRPTLATGCPRPVWHRWCGQVGGTQAMLPSPRKLQPASGPTAHESCKHVGAWAVGGWLQRCTIQTAVHHSADSKFIASQKILRCVVYMIGLLHGRRLIQATQHIIQPKQIARDCSANTADWLNCQYRRPRYYIVQYLYQYRPHLRRYPGIWYTGIPVLEALVVTKLGCYGHKSFTCLSCLLLRLMPLTALNSLQTLHHAASFSAFITWSVFLFSTISRYFVTSSTINCRSALVRLAERLLPGSILQDKTKLFLSVWFILTVGTLHKTSDAVK